MRKAVIAVCTFLTITALCENAMARGAAGVRARPSTVARSHGVAITAHSRGSGYSHVGKVVGGGTSRIMAGVETSTPALRNLLRASSSSPRRLIVFLRKNPEGISRPERSEAETGARAAF